ncbi:hypothetical protein VNO78_32544 [Psophocarpus tetragonolobus]|uniref:glutamate decarboxylase n=1 Tax=Psophocarpus tetragonolobus TaxID=3891 RepID=A0AAN9RP53_PSOTE
MQHDMTHNWTFGPLAFISHTLRFPTPTLVHVDAGWRTKAQLGLLCDHLDEPDCEKLIMASLNKNYVDMDEYPVTTKLQCGNCGSSETIMLAGLAFKRKWQAKSKAESKPYDKPNIDTGANVQVGSSEIIAQYYQFIRLDFESYKNVMENCSANVRALKEGMKRIGRFKIISKDAGMPLVAFSLKDNSKHPVFEIADELRKYGWIVPAYTMPPDAQHVEVLRVVVRDDFNRGLADRLISDIDKVVKHLDTLHFVTTKASHVTPFRAKKSAIEIQQEIVCTGRDSWMARRNVEYAS